ncbi:hypothetical protein SAMN06295879_2591 [Agreia bicolorata]|uniref:Uncharacterized protein n=1 Tax=Agreia bicolorata TaxID=110935 RepID=A0A1T4Y9C6_9MICO|nr:hypothetical protein [Agreia bicolorata]SKA98417.1 hypothetical protein SAMN06295879_2591 [Agreia bicolorata]
MDDAEEHEETPPSPVRPRRSMNSKAIPYGTEEMSGFFSDEWESGWEINHTVVPPR